VHGSPPRYTTTGYPRQRAGAAPQDYERAG
jgi:hypothetical protein